MAEGSDRRPELGLAALDWRQRGIGRLETRHWRSGFCPRGVAGLVGAIVDEAELEWHRVRRLKPVLGSPFKRAAGLAGGVEPVVKRPA